MKFPISIQVIDDRMYLFQGYISEDFKRRLNELGNRIQSEGSPQIGSSTLYINGRVIKKNYTIMGQEYSKYEFDRYNTIIESVKRELGYDE